MYQSKSKITRSKAIKYINLYMCLSVCVYIYCVYFQFVTINCPIYNGRFGEAHISMLLCKLDIWTAALVSSH